MPTSGHKTSRDITVLAARRIWSAEAKGGIVVEMGKPGANVSEIARRHGVAHSLLYRWRQDMAAASVAVPQFMPMVIAAPVMAPPPRQSPMPRPRKRGTPPVAATMTSSIDVVLANGRSVRVGADVDTAALLRIVAALEHSE